MCVAFSSFEVWLIKATSGADSPKLDSVAFERRFLPLFENLPCWMQSAALRVFPAGTRIHEIVKTVTTLDNRTKEIYADKKRALEKGDAEVVKQSDKARTLSVYCVRAEVMRFTGH